MWEIFLFRFLWFEEKRVTRNATIIITAEGRAVGGQVVFFLELMVEQWLWCVFSLFQEGKQKCKFMSGARCLGRVRPKKNTYETCPWHLAHLKNDLISSGQLMNPWETLDSVRVLYGFFGEYFERGTRSWRETFHCALRNGLSLWGIQLSSGFFLIFNLVACVLTGKTEVGIIWEIGNGNLAVHVNGIPGSVIERGYI